jgi:hypothetical protein
LTLGLLTAFDGNNSLKLIDTAYRHGTTHSDDHTLKNPQWIEDEEVDKYKDEVKNSAKVGFVFRLYIKLRHPQKSGRETDDAHLSNDVAWLNINELDELEKCVDTCVDCWKAASPKDRKKMFDLFAISGIFACVCRHGHLLFLCDMQKSGEL